MGSVDFKVVVARQKAALDEIYWEGGFPGLDFWKHRMGAGH